MTRPLFAFSLVLLSACAQAPPSPEVVVVTSLPEIEVITATPLPPLVIVVTATPVAATASPEPSAFPTPVCRKSASVTAEDAGQSISVCGLILEVGETACSSCPNEKVSYLVLKGGMQIVSYDWIFLQSFPYEGICVQVEDTVELLAGRPVFVLGMADGYTGAACTTGAGGVPVCEEGSYLDPVDQSMCY